MELPARFGKFEIISLLAYGCGAGATLFKARDTVSEKLVVLKVVSDKFRGGKAVDFQMRESRVLQMLHHPAIEAVPVLGEHEGILYAAHEYYAGEPLDSVIKARTALSPLQKIDLILQVSSALQHVHDRGIVHRDVKPAKIIWLLDGNVKLIGFEVACVLDESCDLPQQFVGTLPYMSPEMIAGQPIDGRSDIFSLGATIYELIEGELPFRAMHLRDLADKILHEPPPQSRMALNLQLPDLQDIYDGALAKRPDSRYQTCSRLCQDLSRVRRQIALTLP